MLPGHEILVGIRFVNPVDIDLAVLIVVFQSRKGVAYGILRSRGAAKGTGGEHMTVYQFPVAVQCSIVLNRTPLGQGLFGSMGSCGAGRHFKAIGIHPLMTGTDSGLVSRQGCPIKFKGHILYWLSNPGLFHYHILQQNVGYPGIFFHRRIPAGGQRRTPMSLIQAVFHQCGVILFGHRHFFHGVPDFAAVFIKHGQGFKVRFPTAVLQYQTEGFRVIAVAQKRSHDSLAPVTFVLCIPPNLRHMQCGGFGVGQDNGIGGINRLRFHGRNRTLVVTGSRIGFHHAVGIGHIRLIRVGNAGKGYRQLPCGDGGSAGTVGYLCPVLIQQFSAAAQRSNGFLRTAGDMACQLNGDGRTGFIRIGLTVYPGLFYPDIGDGPNLVGEGSLIQGFGAGGILKEGTLQIYSSEQIVYGQQLDIDDTIILVYTADTVILLLHLIDKHIVAYTGRHRLPCHCPVRHSIGVGELPPRCRSGG